MYAGILLLIIPSLVGVSAVSSQNCDQAEMMQCLQYMHNAAQKEGLFFPETNEKLQRYCEHLKTGLECATQIIDRCVTDVEKELIRNLTSDMVQMYEDMCTQGSDLSTRYLAHVGCFKQESHKFTKCSDRYVENIMIIQGLRPDEQVLVTCCTIYEYTRCMKNTVAGSCSKEAADLVEETVVKTLNSSIKFCNQYKDVPTTNCRKNLSHGHTRSSSSIESSDDDSENGEFRIHFSKWLLMVTVVLSMLFH